MHRRISGIGIPWASASPLVPSQIYLRCHSGQETRPPKVHAEIALGLSPWHSYVNDSVRLT
jgi:hypothetical protein